MSVNFTISKLIISNFRGISQFELDFKSKTPIYLIGGNNSGKSTILNAIALALKGAGFYKYSPDEYDFFHHTDNTTEDEFTITVYFKAGKVEHLPAVQGVGNPTFVHGSRVKGRILKNGRMDHNYGLVNHKDEVITYSPRTPIKKDKEKYKGHGVGWTQYNAKPDDIRDFLPDIWFLTPDNLYKSLYEWKTGPLQKLSSMLTSHFLSDSWEFDFENEKRKMPSTMEKVHSFFRSAVESFPLWKDDIKPKLELTLTKYIGREAHLSLHPKIQSIEEWLSQQLAASFSADSGGSLTPLERMGQGWQSLVRIASLDVLRQYPDECKNWVILLYEEPETYFHSHLRRKLRDVLSDLAKSGWVVICSTHAPEFIDFSSSQQIIRLWRYGETISAGNLLTNELEENTKFQEKLDERGNHEMLFANKVIFCEGKDDYYGLKMYFDKNDIDLNGKSISIVDIGGVHNMLSYANIAKNLGIPWCALTDEDKDESGKINSKTSTVRDSLEKLKSDCDIIPIWKGKLELTLGLNFNDKATPEWFKNNIAIKALDNIRREYPDFYNTCNEIESWMKE